jgi:hypothetical protein
MEQIKSNFKTVIIMETKINLDKPINLSIINTKDFVLWFKQEIKNLVEDQKESKRDRKDVKHPCPEKRKYRTLEAFYRVLSNKETLRSYYALYYALRHCKDIDWAEFSYTKGVGWSGRFSSTLEKVSKPIDENFIDYYTFQNKIGDLVYRYAEKIIREGAEKALCNC